jgi:hypothetical protein
MPFYLLQGTNKFRKLKPMASSNFPIFSFVRVVILFLAFFLRANVNADDLSNIGSGSPGLRVITRVGNSNKIGIYRILPETPFGAGIGSGATNGTIQVIVDQGYNFQKAERLTVGTLLPLYPFASNSAFTDEVGIEWFWPSSNDWAISSSRAVGYALTDGSLTVFTNVQQVARAKYHLNSDEIFLGLIDDRVFFCKNLLRPAKIFWREQGSQEVYCYHLPGSVVNIFGVTRALRRDKDVGFVILRKVWRMFPNNLFLAPYEDAFIEISFSNGKSVRPEQ